MGALYAQGLPWDQAHRKVRMYASRMSSVRHLLQARIRPHTLHWRRFKVQGLGYRVRAESAVWTASSSATLTAAAACQVMLCSQKVTAGKRNGDACYASRA